MTQAIIIKLPKIKKIDAIRKKHDSQFKFIENHVTLVFPFKKVNQVKLENHIKNSIKSIKPIKLVLKGIKKSKKEYYLFLVVKQGREQILKIHKNLYSGSFLTKWFRKDIPYDPHLTLGVFKTKLEIDKIIKEVKKENLNWNTIVDKISLITLNKDISIKSIKNFKLK